MKCPGQSYLQEKKPSHARVALAPGLSGGEGESQLEGFLHANFHQHPQSCSWDSLHSSKLILKQSFVWEKPHFIVLNNRYIFLSHFNLFYIYLHIVSALRVNIGIFNKITLRIFCSIKEY